jgi:hypothetical protein
MGTSVKDNVIEIPGGREISEATVGEPYFDDSGAELVAVICVLKQPKRLVFVETEAVEFEKGLYVRVENKELEFVDSSGALAAAKELKGARIFKLVEVE